MLPEMLGEMQPYWEQFLASGQEDFGQYLNPKAGEVSDAILRVADKHAETINVPALQKVYQSLRGRAGKIMSPHVPELARILQRHMS